MLCDPTSSYNEDKEGENISDNCIDWFQPETSTFSMSALIIWYHKTGTQIPQYNFKCF